MKSSRKAEIQLWGKVENVESLIGPGGGGAEVYRGEGLTKGKIYHPVGMAFEVYTDRSRVLCYIIEDDDGVVGLRAMKHFKVVR